MKVTRVTRQLMLPGGAAVEVALDEGHIAAGPELAPIRWNSSLNQSRWLHRINWQSSSTRRCRCAFWRRARRRAVTR